jgi:hypothetical protein
MTYKSLSALLLVPILFCITSGPLYAEPTPPSGEASVDGVWQWSVPARSIPDRRAFLWIPPDCEHVRGLVVAVHNMLETPLFERRAFRDACAQSNIGLLVIFSGHDRIGSDDKDPNHPRRSALDIFLNPNFPKGQEDPKGAGEDLQKVLDALAEESGYAELRHVPIMPVGHSSAGSFVWHLYRWDPSRIFAMMPFKTGIKDDGPANIPIFNVESEWFDYGNASNNVSTKPTDIKAQMSVRAKNPAALFGFYIDVGAGHCDVSDDSMKLVSLFLKKAVAARIPADAPIDQPVHLKPVSVESGWLLDVEKFGKPENRAVPHAQWKGDQSHAFWYFDQEMAQGVQDHVAAQFAKKPQQINFVKDDGSVSTDGGTYNFSPKFIDDIGTFRLQAKYIDELTKSDLYPGEKLENDGEPILYRVNSGAVVQVGPDAFRICPHGGPIVPQGNPWEPTIVAYTLGDDAFRPTERPAHARVDIINRKGEEQTLDFPEIPSPDAGTATVPLTAKASSGLPVEYYVISGPAQVGEDGKSLTLLPVPPKTKHPVRVLVAAFQWGRSTAPRVQSAGPVIREFLIH